MKAKRNSERRQWNLLFFTHMLLWLVGLGFGIYATSISAPNQTLMAGLFLLMWTILFVAHASVFYYSKGRGDASERERQSYRDGFNDAMRHLQNSEAPPIEHHLALDEDGELMEMPLESKRKRS